MIEFCFILVVGFVVVVVWVFGVVVVGFVDCFLFVFGFEVVVICDL